MDNVKKVKKVKVKKVAASKMTRTTEKWYTYLLDSFDLSCITIEYNWRQDSACAGRCTLGKEPKGRKFGQAKAGREFKRETHGFLEFDLAQIPCSLSVAPRRHFCELALQFSVCSSPSVRLPLFWLPHDPRPIASQSSLTDFETNVRDGLALPVWTKQADLTARHSHQGTDDHRN